MPRLLSQTGAFKDTADLAPDNALIPYDLIVPFWSDGAEKSRWISVAGQTIKFAPTGEWVFPQGTVFVKTFGLATNELNPGSLRRLETRLLVSDGSLAETTTGRARRVQPTMKSCYRGAKLADNAPLPRAESVG